MAVERYQLADQNDNERVNFLYADFPSDKNLNPKHWESKYSFWSSEVGKSCRFYGDICTSCKKLQTVFQHPETKRTPKGLLTVLSKMYESGRILLKQDVADISPDKSWGRWSLSLTYKISGWAWQKFVTGINEDTEFVVKDLLEEMADALLDYHYKNVEYEKTDHIVPWNVLKNVYKINNKPISEDNLVCIVGYLKSTGKCRIGVTEDSEKIIKFKPKVQNKLESICHSDFEIIKLKKAIAKLSLESKTLEKELQKLKLQAQICVKNKDRAQAKKILGQRQKIDKKLRIKQDAVFAMKDHLGIVRDAETTKLITDAFNSSANLLNRTYTEQGLTVDNVENIMDKAAEANEMARDVSNALTVGLKQVEDEEYDMDELEKELAELDVDQLGPAEKEIFDLPQVPVHSPSKTSTPSAVRPNFAKRRELEMAL